MTIKLKTKLKIVFIITAVIATSLSIANAQFLDKAFGLNQVQPLPAGAIMKITWHALTYAPVEFDGKTLPTQGSQIIVSLYTKGLSGGVIRWFLNGQEQDQFSNEKIFTTKVATYISGGNEYEIKAIYQNDISNIKYAAAVNIPLEKPEIYFMNKTSEGNIAVNNYITAPMGSQLTLVAKPYFFNAPPNELLWKWALGDKEITGQPKDPSIITILTPTYKTDTSISVSASNQRAFLSEAASAAIKLFIQ